MDHDFWHERWRTGEINFHQGKPNPLLVAHFDQLQLADGARVFVPLCGKTLDIAWLLSKGCTVAGAELSATAIEELFAELGVTPDISEHGTLQRYSAPGIDIFVGDIFDMDAAMLGPIDAVFDRAALVALPADMRIRYAQHVMAITNNAVQLLITFQYDQAVMEGPPFSISKRELAQHYSDDYNIQTCEITDVVGGLKGKCPATETITLLTPRR